MSELTHDRAAAHEALFTKLEKLCRQAEAIAQRRPDAAVPPETRTAAETLLYDTRRMVGEAVHSHHPGRRSKPGRGLPPAAESFAGLATQLGQALAGLDAFEAANTVWNADLKCFAWQLKDTPLPVRRLRPELLHVPDNARESREAEQMRKKIVARFAERYEDGFEAGLKAARDAAKLAVPSA